MPIDDTDLQGLFPIVYARGFAMRREEIDEISADPFCGFKLGSTACRATSNRERPALVCRPIPAVRVTRKQTFRASRVHHL